MKAPTRGLVLGGGGVGGIAWYGGLVVGMREAGIDLGTVDRIVGTSAGSVVGAFIGTAQNPADLEKLIVDDLAPTFASVTGGATSVDMMGPAADPAVLERLLPIAGRWMATGYIDAADRAAFAAFALAAEVPPEDAFTAGFDAHLSHLAFPANLTVCTVAVESGAFRGFTADDAVPLSRAVAASSSVPGIYPPVTINGGRYVDGGIASGTSAELLLPVPPTHVLVVAAVTADVPLIGPIFQLQLAVELAALREAGSDVVLIAPDAADLAAIGPNLMDAARVAPAFEAGVARGRREAKTLAGAFAT